MGQHSGAVVNTVISQSFGWSLHIFLHVCVDFLQPLKFTPTAQRHIRLLRNFPEGVCVWCVGV